MKSPLKTARIAAVALVTTALVVPAVGWAAGGNTVHVKAPHKAKVGKTFHYTAKGKSSVAGNELATFVNTKTKCGKTYKKELATQFGTTRLLLTLPQGKYTKKFSIKPVSTGKHFICAYVIGASTGKTLAKAKSKYNTK